MAPASTREEGGALGLARGVTVSKPTQPGQPTASPEVQERAPLPRWPEERLALWWNSATPDLRANYVADLSAFMERARRMRRRGVAALLAVVLTAGTSLQASSLSLPASVVGALGSGALTALLPAAYGLALRTVFVAWAGIILARGALGRILATRAPGLVLLEIHAPSMPPESMGVGDLLAWAGADRSAPFAMLLRWSDAALAAVLLVALLLLGPGVASCAALRGSGGWGWPGLAVGVLCVLSAVRPLQAVLNVHWLDRPRDL